MNSLDTLHETKASLKSLWIVIVMLTSGCDSGFEVNRNQLSDGEGSELVTQPMDISMPELAWTSEVPSLTSQTELNLSFSFKIGESASVQSLTCQVDDDTPLDCSRGQFEATNLEEGLRTLSVYLVDSAGQDTQLTANVRVDQTPPVLTINQAPSSVTGADNAEFSFNAIDQVSPGDNLTFQCLLDTGDWQVCSSPLVLENLSMGDHQLSIAAYDQAGNVSEVSTYQWLIDNSAPSITITEKPNSVINNASARVTFSARQGETNLSNFQCRLDNERYKTCTSPKTMTQLSDGSHRLRIRVRDRAGSFTTPTSFAWIVDTTSPSLTWEMPPPAEVESDTISFAFSALDSTSGIASIQCSLDNQTTTGCTSPANYDSLSEGTHQFQVTVVDKAGNSDQLQHSFTYRKPPPILDGQVLYQQNCAGCHGSLANSTKLNRNFATIKEALASIPQMSMIRLSDEQIQAIEQSLKTPESPTEVDINVAAERYFPSNDAMSAPKRIFRLTQTQLDLTLKALLPALTIPLSEDLLPPDPKITNYDFAEVLSFNNSNFTPFEKWLEQISLQAFDNPESIIDCRSQNNSQTCLRNKATAFLNRVFRGDAPAEKMTEFVDLFLASVTNHGFAQGVSNLVDASLSSPLFLFREEFDTNSNSDIARPEQLQFLTYTLADTSAEGLQLNSNQANSYLQEQAKPNTLNLILNSPEARQKLARFIEAWLEVKKPGEYSISRQVYPEFTNAVAQSAVKETQRLLASVMTQDRPSLKSLTQVQSSYVDSNLENLYGVAASSADGSTLANLDPSERFGIFSHISFIASHSGPDNSRPMKRGAFFARKVLCIPIEGTPPDVDTTLPNDSNMTLRQKIEGKTNKGSCLGCHATLNPMGFFMESYSGSGKWRTTDNFSPIDASFSYADLDEGTLNTEGPVETLKHLTDSVRYKQCFIRQMFRYYMGREETTQDDPVLKKMFLAFGENNDQDILSALTVLVNDPNTMRRED